MAWGPPICASCGEIEDVEEHRYLETKGCSDDFTVWLCNECYGKADSLVRQIIRSAVVKAALAGAKARGTKLGGYHGGPKVDRSLGIAAHKARADAFAQKVGPIIREMRTRGLSFAAIASELTRTGVATPRAGNWTAGAVQRALMRTEPPKGA